jgi:hypothetical protein
MGSGRVCPIRVSSRNGAEIVAIGRGQPALLVVQFAFMKFKWRSSL